MNLQHHHISSSSSSSRRLAVHCKCIQSAPPSSSSSSSSKLLNAASRHAQRRHHPIAPNLQTPTSNYLPRRLSKPLAAAASSSSSNSYTSSTRAPPPAAAEQQVAIPALAPTAAAAASAAAVMYDADYTADTWSRRPVPVVARLLEITAAFGGWWARAQLHRNAQKAAADMREVLVRLGPAFVKIGQALSSRPDVLPPEYLQELELLQDRIPPFSDQEALQVIEEELGVPWRSVFSSLSSSPVAAASLGQVYRGRLCVTGAEVAVKVQRPGVVDAIGRDTFILRNIAGIARQQLKLNTDLPALVDEWAASLFKELDYRREAANAIRFGRLFSFMPEVVVPHMYTEYTTPRVLVMEWIEGERLRTASQQAPAAAAAAAGGKPRPNATQVKEDLRLVEIGVRCSLEQMLEEGFYHADPHPGNLLKTKDGRLAYLDFGMMGEIQPAVRQALIRATLHLVNREYERLAEDFVVLGLLPQGTDMDDVIPALTGVFQNALSGGVSNISFSTLSSDLGRTMYKYSFRIPPYYTLLVRSLSVLEGIALASDPNYKVLGAAYPWVSRRLLTQNSPELHATLNNLLYDRDGQFNFDRMESLLEQAAKAAVSPSSAAAAAAAAAAGSSTARSSAAAAGGSDSGLSLVTNSVVSGILQPVQIITRPAGQLLGTFLPTFGSSSSSGMPGQQQQQQLYSGRGSEAAAAGGPLALLLSPEGAYIRGILETELAKGLDAAWRLAVDQTLDNTTQQIEGFVTAFPVPLPLLPRRQQSAAAVAAASNGSSSSSSRVDLLETLMAMPKLAAAEDVSQLEGLTRLANQLAAFSTARQQQQEVLAGSSSISGGPVQQQQQTDQLQQTAVVLNWLVSEVRLLSPEARREALTIPLHILSKLASRLAARAVRAILTPTAAAAAANGASSSSSSRVRVYTPTPGRGTAVNTVNKRRIASSSGKATPADPAAAAAAVAAAAAGKSTAAGSSAAANAEPVTAQVLQQPEQQQQQQRRLQQGRQQPKTPPQRQLIYNPEVQAVFQQRQQQQQQLVGGSITPAVNPAGEPYSASAVGSRALGEYVAQQQQQEFVNGNGRRRSTQPEAFDGGQQQQQQPVVTDESYGIGSSSRNGSSSSSSRNGGSSSSSNGWVDSTPGVVVVEADAVLEPVDSVMRQ